MFSKIITSALFAGFCAGLVAALLQLIFVQPVLLHAELYEGGDLVYSAAEGASASQEIPGFDVMRDGLSVLFSALTYVGYALMMVAFMSIAAERGAVITPRTGLIWGIAGFVTMHFAPAFSLPPEVPGMASADLTARQVLWCSTAAATGVAIAMIALGQRPLFWMIGAALLVLPHLIGGPAPDIFTGPLPPELASLFAVRALGVGLAGWAVLGCLCGFFWQRETADA